MEERIMEKENIEKLKYATMKQYQELNQKDSILKALQDEFFALQEECSKLLRKQDGTKESLKEIENFNNLLDENVKKTKQRYYELNADYSERTPGLCPDCNGTGIKITYSTDADGYQYMKKSKCECYNVLYKQKLYNKSALREYKDFDYKKYEPEQIKYFVRLIAKMKSKKDIEKPIIYITGGVGSGKTYLANNIGKEAVKHLIATMFINAPVMFNKLMQLKTEDLNEADLFRKELRKVRLLIIDDLGTENITEPKKEELFNLIEDRIENNKVTMITTNLNTDETKEIYGERIFSRIFGNAKIIQIKNKDLRMK